MVRPRCRRIQAPGVVLLALLGVHLLLHRRRRAPGVDRGHPHTVLALLAPQGVGQRPEAELGGGVARPRRVGVRPEPELTNTTVPRAARSAGSSARVSRAGAVRLTSSCGAATPPARARRPDRARRPPPRAPRSPGGWAGDAPASVALEAGRPAGTGKIRRVSRWMRS